jgi:serine/threonine protein kinase
MLLDYAPGGNMTRTLQKEKRFTEDRARFYLAEILLALEDLHKRDIIYRDLKPDNIVFDEDGHAMITDFGLSKVGISLNDQAKSFCGSPAYLAPEILRRQGHGKPVDWYLLGVLLYEMLVGIPPYYNNNKDILY